LLTESPSVTEEEISHVENICNELIRKNLGVVVNIFNENTPFKELENVIFGNACKIFYYY
jgi:alanyl-tRNA synthetase